MTLCEKCLSIDFQPPTGLVHFIETTIAGNDVITHEGDVFHVHSPNLRNLERSAATTGCRFCRMLEHNLKHWISPIIRQYDANGSWRPENEDKVGVLLRLSPCRRRLRVLCGGRHLTFSKVSMPTAFMTFTDKANTDEHDTTTGSPQCLTLLKTWLYDCILAHDECLDYAHASGEQTLPTRVIDVGPPGSNEEHVLLVSGNGRIAPYVALSHCWGKSNIVTTTTSSLDQHQTRGIPIQSLPLNFRDAIAVTRALTCRYLWIDSLCIIQDSHEDWEAESSSMHLVYRNAILTISIARSLNPHTGCFVRRDPRLVRPLSLAFHSPEPDSTGSEATDSDDDKNGHKGVGNGRRHAFWQLDREIPPDGPLHHRAWVLQEQAFSGRVVSFSDEGISWSCASADHSEFTPYKKRRSQRPRGGRDIYHRFQAQVVDAEEQPVSSRLRSSVEHRRKLYDAWYDMVVEYSRRDLTFDTDRLQAIASLAYETSGILGHDTYCAGLWAQDLVRGLLWSTMHQSRHAHRYRRVRPPLLYVAPSWSWASVLGDKVRFDALTLNHGVIRDDATIPVPGLGHVPEDDWERLPDPGDDEVEVLEVRCVPAGQNEFAQLRGGVLRLEGPIMRTVLQLPDHLHDPITRARVGRIIWDEAHPPPSLQGQVLRCLFMARKEQGPVVIEGKTVQASMMRTLCLALVSTGLGPEECRRVGLGLLDNDGDWSDTEKEVVEIV